MGTVLNTFVLTVVVIWLILIKEGYSHQIDNNPFKRGETLDPEGKYFLEWEVDWKLERITFNVTVETRGWVGLGLSTNGIPSTTLTDFVIGGVNNRQSYFSDRHIVPRSDVSYRDIRQDYTLLQAGENRTHTFLSFSRAIDTCDNEDYEITLNKISIIWAYGANDNAEGYHVQKSGSRPIYLLDADYTPRIARTNSGDPILITSNTNENIPSDTKIWSVKRSLTLPSNGTSYYCSIHNGPTLKKKHHFIGFDIHFENDESRLRTHHMLMYRCHAPPGFTNKQVFEPHVANPGEACYLARAPGAGSTSSFPHAFCTELFNGWTIGGKALFLPDHVGFPLGGESGDGDEYFMFQMHYDNPDRASGIRVDLRMDFFYTSQLRPNDGGLFGISTDLPGLPEHILVAPNSVDHRIFSHCSSECTGRFLPSKGIKIVAAQLHAHNSAHAMRLHHFRGDRELPWIMYDDNYDNGFQPLRFLRNEIDWMPGDQLTLDCHYTNNGTIVGGFTTSQEMCNAYLIHYENIKDYSFCASGIQSEAARQEFLGIQNVSWVQSELEWIVDTPTSLAGLKVTEVSDYFVNWTPAKRQQLQTYHWVHPASGGCHKDMQARTALVPSARPIGVPPLGNIDTPDDFRGSVSYPLEIPSYVPPARMCPVRRRGWNN